MDIKFLIGLIIISLNTEKIIFVQETDSVKIVKQTQLNELERKLTQFPDSVQLRNMLAIKYANLNDIENAEKHLQYLLAIDSTNFVALNNIGNLFFMKGDLNSAEFYYQKALNYAEGEHKDGANLNLGLLYAAADQDSIAIELFAQVMQDSNDYRRIGDLLGISIEENQLAKADELKPQKKIDKIAVKQLAFKAQKKKTPSKVKKIESKKTIGDKGFLPKEEIENIFYWAY